MACDLCDPNETDQQQPLEPTPGKFCGHPDKCDCSAPEKPTPLACDDPTNSGGTCLPDQQVRDLERVVTDANESARASQAEAADATTALEELKEKAEGLKQALEVYANDQDSRDKRLEALREFKACKDPKPYPGDKECVDGVLGEVCNTIHENEQYRDWVEYKLALSRVALSHKTRQRKDAEKRYDSLRDVADKCLTRFEVLRSKYEETDKTDVVRRYLYFAAICRLHDNSENCCLDPDQYENDLCDAFQEMCDASTREREAAQDEAKWVAELESVNAELENLGDTEKLWVEIEDLVDLCCKPTKDPGVSDECAEPEATVTKSQ